MKEEALEYHKSGIRPGKIGTSILTSVGGKDDLSLAYTPGVAVPCLEIARDKKMAYEYTARGNRVGVISNGTAVLGLGNIGALAGKPVMEGKALLFKYFGRVDAVDVEVASEDIDEIVKTIELIAPTFGGINLEDIKAPECFEIENRLKGLLDIPVFHDDQHGTAVVVGAGILRALKVVNKKIEDVKIVFSGAGSAGIACLKMLLNLGVKRENVVICDLKGVVYVGREMMEYKKEFAIETGKRTLGEVIEGADVFVGVSAKDVLSVDMLKSMNDNPVVFALANPDPEIAWDVAHSARDDLIMATGRSDFPNQVNNVLVFPGIFRGALDCRSSCINEEMKVAAVHALVGLVGDGESVGGVVRIIPDIFDERVLVEVAFSVAQAAVESGVAVEGFDLGGYREKLESEFLKKGKTGEVVVGGRYKHFKGNEYEVLWVGRDSDDVEKRVVIYRGFYDSEEFGRNPVWIRGYEDFVGFKELDGKKIKRFEFLGKVDG